MIETDSVYFHEEQRFRQPWLWGLLVGVCLLETGIFGYGMVRQLVMRQPWGDRPMSDTAMLIVGTLTILTSLGLLVLFYLCRLITEVRRDALRFRFVPFHFKFHAIPLSSLRRWEAVTYSPLREYGGWGIRYGWKGKAYNVSGDRGVRVETAEGEKLLFGSQRAEELARAIESAKQRET